MSYAYFEPKTGQALTPAEIAALGLPTNDAEQAAYDRAGGAALFAEERAADAALAERKLKKHRKRQRLVDAKRRRCADPPEPNGPDPLQASLVPSCEHADIEIRHLREMSHANTAEEGALEGEKLAFDGLSRRVDQPDQGRGQGIGSDNHLGIRQKRRYVTSFQRFNTESVGHDGDSQMQRKVW